MTTVLWDTCVSQKFFNYNFERNYRVVYTSKLFLCRKDYNKRYKICIFNLVVKYTKTNLGDIGKTNNKTKKDE